MTTDCLAKNLIIFSDLDGTLLDHDTYSWEAAKPALERLKTKNFPVILASSKTAAEISVLREQMGLEQFPAIVENGAGILKSGKADVLSDTDYQRLLREIDQLPQELSECFDHFASWSVEELAEKTKLSLEAAELAKTRQFTEPGIWTGTPEQFLQFTRLLLKRGIFTQQGGRFISLSRGGTKQLRMSEILEDFLLEDEYTSIALGDAPNDLAMLEAADLGVIVQNPSHLGIPKMAREENGKILRSTLAGPGGWNEMMLKILDRLKEQHG